MTFGSGGGAALAAPAAGVDGGAALVVISVPPRAGRRRRPALDLPAGGPEEELHQEAAVLGREALPPGQALGAPAPARPGRAARRR